MKQELSIFKKELNEELTSILSFWMKNTVDDNNGGFFGQIDHNNQIIEQASKGVVLNSRILWTFSAAFNTTGKPEYLEMATRAYDYINQYFYDDLEGGLIWEVDYMGEPVNARKQTYAQGFGIYGYSEYYKASGNEDSLDRAKALYNSIETHCFDAQFGGYIEAFAKDWHPLEDMRLSPKDDNYPKSMNTHLHILEAYTNLYQVWPNSELRIKIKAIIRIFLDEIIDSVTGHFNLFFERSWHSEANIVSYGHDIEGTWLLTEAAELVADEALLFEVAEMALKMTDIILSEGAAKDGSIYYERDLISGHLDTDKHWWPQAEAMVAYLNAYKLSNDQRYLNEALKVWLFINDYLIDNDNGEWYWSVNEKGEPSKNGDKAGFWKCPYHNGRACLESMERLSAFTS